MDLRIIGIDPGSRITGFGIIDYAKGRLQYVTSGCIRMTEKGLPERVRQIFAELSVVISEYRPAHAAVEQVFMHKNARSALTLGQARVAALSALSMQGLYVAEYPTRSVKLAVVGHGGAEKTQVQHMVRVLLNLSSTPQADAADALAVALCHAYTLPSQSQIGSVR